MKKKTKQNEALKLDLEGLLLELMYFFHFLGDDRKQFTIEWQRK